MVKLSLHLDRTGKRVRLFATCPNKGANCQLELKKLFILARLKQTGMKM